MRVKVRILKFGLHASDGSIVSSDVVKQYLDSPEAQEAIRAHRMIGSLTHRVRNIKAQDFSESVASNLSKTVGKDDGMILLDSGCPPTHYIDKMWIENGAWWAEVQIYDENDFDDKAKQAILRIKGLLKHSSIGISCVLVGLWSGMKNGEDRLEKLVACKGVRISRP